MLWNEILVKTQFNFRPPEFLTRKTTFRSVFEDKVLIFTLINVCGVCFIEF